MSRENLCQTLRMYSTRKNIYTKNQMLYDCYLFYLFIIFLLSQKEEYFFTFSYLFNTIKEITSFYCLSGVKST